MRRYTVLQNDDRKITQDDDTTGQVEETDDNRHTQRKKINDGKKWESSSWHDDRLEIAHILGLLERSSYSTTKHEGHKSHITLFLFRRCGTDGLRARPQIIVTC